MILAYYLHTAEICGPKVLYLTPEGGFHGRVRSHPGEDANTGSRVPSFAGETITPFWREARESVNSDSCAREEMGCAWLPHAKPRVHHELTGLEHDSVNGDVREVKIVSRLS